MLPGWQEVCGDVQTGSSRAGLRLMDPQVCTPPPAHAVLLAARPLSCPGFPGPPLPLGDPAKPSKSLGP